MALTRAQVDLESRSRPLVINGGPRASLIHPLKEMAARARRRQRLWLPPLRRGFGCAVALASLGRQTRPPRKAAGECLPRKRRDFCDNDEARGTFPCWANKRTRRRKWKPFCSHASPDRSNSEKSRRQRKGKTKRKHTTPGTGKCRHC